MCAQPSQKGRAKLSFVDIQYEVQTTLDGKVLPPLTKMMGSRKKKKTRYLLRGVTGEVSAGSVLAIMGPSGAVRACHPLRSMRWTVLTLKFTCLPCSQGKTTLLNVLTLECAGGVPRGQSMPLTLTAHHL